MRITVCGAAGEVTGSAYLVQTATATVLVDCGMFQGAGATDAKNRNLGPIDPRQLSSIVVTHAHLDHTGRLPLLTAGGFRGNLWCTPATEEFTQIILQDSAQLQQADAERKNRKRERAGVPPVRPLYSKIDVDRLNPLTRKLPLGRAQEIVDGITIRFFEAGHILGSASVEMVIREAGKVCTVVFSGDLGPLATPILREFETPPRADVVFQETTYGSREHRPYSETVAEFRGVLREAAARRMKILIPAFAIGRSQAMIYEIARAVRDGVCDPMPVILDSPMAIEATEAYTRHRHLFDAEAIEHERLRDLQPQLDHTQFARTADDSKALNHRGGPMVVIAGSGMCDAGRIIHHLKNNLYKPTTAVIIVGFQTPGSLGHRLVHRAKEVRIHGQRVAVKAQIHTLGGFSGHAGQADLLTWAGRLAANKPRWILTHGENDSRTAYRQLMKQRYGIEAECPMCYDVIEID